MLRKKRVRSFAPRLWSSVSTLCENVKLYIRRGLPPMREGAGAVFHSNVSQSFHKHPSFISFRLSSRFLAYRLHLTFPCIIVITSTPIPLERFSSLSKYFEPTPTNHAYINHPPPLPPRRLILCPRSPPPGFIHRSHRRWRPSQRRRPSEYLLRRQGRFLRRQLPREFGVSILP